MSCRHLALVVRNGPQLLLVVALVFSAGCATSGQSTRTDRDDGERAPVLSEPEEASAQTLYAMGRVLARRGKSDQAEVVFVKLINEYPSFPPGYCSLAELRAQQGRTDAAILVLQKAVELFPNDHILQNDLGVCLMLDSRFEEALAHFEQATLLEPREERYRANKALALALTGDDEAALTLYRAVVGEKDAQHNLELLKEHLGSLEGT